MEQFGIGAEATSTAADEAAQLVRVAPGTRFRLDAGRSAVAVEHVAGWSDVATLQGRPAGHRSWRVHPASSESELGRGRGTHADEADRRGASAPAYDVRPQASSGAETAPGQGGAGRGSSGAGDAGGLLRLAVPEKWISLDISTEGCPVSVTRLVEASLGVATRGGPLQLGTVRGTHVDLSTATTGAAPAGGSPQPGGGHAAIAEKGDEAGSVTGGEVSGTTVTVAASGPIRLRRLVGGSMQLSSDAAATAGPTTPAGTVAAANQLPAVNLGAVYGGRIHIRTGGGSVRIGTLDCGGYSAGGASGGDARAQDTASGASRAAAGAAPQPNAPAAVAPYGVGGGVPGGGGGAAILSHGGAVVVDCLEGWADVDSGGGAVRVLLQSGLRSCSVRSGGGPVEVALASGAGLQLLEVVGADPGGLQVEPGLEPDVRPVQDAGPTAEAAVPQQPQQQHSAGGSWRVAVAAGDLAHSRGGGRGMEPGTAGGGGGGGGVVRVDAGGGVVRLRRLSWMEALRAKVAERGVQAGGP
ncbi:hypothetical protein GPECTOR_29g56 [Gonium pectorale]|uniref:Uncharacterized protein n=1 Tax=Gonium pectorale TaxID=33097 RepID=A0A150GEK5_GONPE|nr:hypothetical protein GPECTOR_29g56 [Gonium pectorale]|eukprot:KXZ48279.1 hypothetical protein GPECTOR_29g56 [Gonium pectorale]